MKTLLAVLSATVAATAFADTFVWTGAADAYWTNAANWCVAGVTPNRCPGSLLQSDATRQWEDASAERDCAVFDETGTGPEYIDLAGLLCVSNLIFRGVDIPLYTFGKTAANSKAWASQRLGIKGGGSIVFESTLGRAPVFSNGLAPNVVSGASSFVNESSVVIDLGPRIGHSRVKSVPTYSTLTFSGEGSGGFTVGELLFNWNNGGSVPFTTLNLKQSGLLKFTGNWENIYALKFTPSAAVSQTVEIASGVSLAMTYLWSADITVDGNARLWGAGTFKMLDQSKTDVNTHITIAAGKTFEISTRVSEMSGGARRGWWLKRADDKTAYTGTLKLTSATDCRFAGDLMQEVMPTLETEMIGEPGGDSPLGKGSCIFVGNGNTFAYVGTGESSARTFVITNFSANAGATVTLSHRGTGNWFVSGIADQVKSGKTDTLVLDSRSASDAIVGAPLDNGANGTLALKKTGSGKWTLTGVQTYTGTTTLSGGTLAYTESQTVSAVVVNGEVGIEVPDGVTVTLASLSRTSGTLDLKLAGSGKVIVSGAAFGAAEPWIKVNGSAANVQADGSITAADHTWVSTIDIPAHGGVISSTVTPGDVVGITTDGEGEDPVTIESSEGAAVNGIVQKTAADATVRFSAGQTLTTGLLAVEPSAGSLTIGANASDGALAASGGKMTFDVGAKDSKLVVNAPFAKAGVKLAKTGEGEADLSLAAGESVSGTIAEGVMAFKMGESTLTAEGGVEGFVGYEIAANADANILTVTGDRTSSVPLVLGGVTDAGHQIKILPAESRVDIRGKATRLSVGAIDLRALASNVASTSTVVIADGACVVQEGTSSVIMGGPSGTSSAQGSKRAFSELIVSNAVLTRASMADTDAWTDTTKCILVGNDWGSGVVRLEADGVITNRLRIGGWSWYAAPEVGLGAFCQYGGNAYLTGATVVGAGGSGYMEINGGTCILNESLYLGHAANNGQTRYGDGVLAVYGGNFRVQKLNARGINEAHVQMGSSPLWAIGHFKGGLVEFQAPLLGEVAHSKVALNFAGALVSAYSLVPRNSTDGIYINITGGELILAELAAKNSPSCVTYFNFNGGTYRHSGGVGTALSFDAAHANRATVYERGFVFSHRDWFNVDGSPVHCYGPFRAAPGKGISSVALPDDVKALRFVCAPIVEIVGDGTGATAFAEFDSRRGVITNIVVTSPGWDYTTATARIVSIDASTEPYVYKTKVGDIPCVLQDNKRGPFVFDGAPQRGYSRTLDMMLHGPNEFGSVEVLAGTLRAGGKDAIPEDADIVILGGTLDMNTNNLVFTSLSGTGGTLQGKTDAEGRLLVTTTTLMGGLSGVSFKDENGAVAVLKQTMTGSWTVNVADLLVGKVVGVPDEFSFGADATLTITGDVTQLDPETKYTVFEAEAGAFEGMPTWTNAADYPEWKIRKVGGKIRLSKPKGMLLIVR